MLVVIIGDIAGIALTIWQNMKVPFWVWIFVLIIGLVIAQFLAFHKLRVQRDELQVKLQMDKDTPKLARPELYITYRKHEFGIAGEGKYIGISVDKGTPVLSIEAVEICLVGQRKSSLNGEVQESSERLWFEPTNIFNISGISSGTHDAELVAFGNGEWWKSHAFPISFPEIKP